MFSTHFQITKVDGERREVAGIITCQKEDKDGETLDYAPSRVEFARWSNEAYEATKALGDGKQSFGNLREQHSKRAVGKFVQPLQFDDSQKTIYGVAKVYDDDVWQKCTDGVYNAFSVGGQLVGTPRWEGKTKFITISPREVSLVDNPALDATHFDFVRSADAEVVKMAFKHRSREEQTADAVVDIIKASFEKGEIGRVLEHIARSLVGTSSDPDPQDLTDDGQDKDEKVSGSGVSGGSGEVAAVAKDPALEPVPNPPQVPGKVAPNTENDLNAWKAADADPTGGPDMPLGAKTGTYAPDAVPDKHQPEATDPTDQQVHESAKTVQFPNIPAQDPTNGKPDTQLGLKPSPENAPLSNLMLAKDGTNVTSARPDGGPDFQGGTDKALPEVAPDPLKPTGAQMGARADEALPADLVGKFLAACDTLEKFTCEKRAVSDKERADLADKGHAMPDGSYPIANVSDLHNAVQAVGRAKNPEAVKQHIKRRASQLGAESALPDTWKAAKIELQKATTGAPNLMANETEKAARTASVMSHLQNLKGHADKLKQAVDGAHAAIHDTCDKCMKLAGGPGFDADTDHAGGQNEPLGDSTAAQSTEVKAAKAEIEKLAGLVATLTEQVKTLAAKPAEAEKAAKPESVIGDPAKAAKPEPTQTEKLAADAKEQEEMLTLAKAAMGVKTDGKGNTVRVNADPKAMDALYKKLTNATQYQAARKYMTQGQ
jgi:hypothetical protein